MKNITPVFVFNSLDIVRGGLTKAVLTRANELINFFDDVIFLTLKFQPDFENIKNQLYNSGKLDKRVKVLNFFQDISGNRCRKVSKRRKEFKIKEKGLTEFLDKNNELPSYRYYQNGIYVKYKRFNHNNNLLFIDYMNESRNRIRRDEYNEDGVLVRSRHMDLFKNKPRLDRYFDTKGNCYLSVWINEKGEEKRTVYFRNRPREYKTLYDFYTRWVEEKLSSITNPIVMSDSRFTDKLVISLKNKHIKKIAILHNNHFKEPYNNTAGIRKSWEPFFENIDSFDAVVFLTNDQKNDVIHQFGEKSKYVVIPHFANPLILNRSIDYNPYLAVSLARYDEQKRLDEAINAFKLVVKEIPKAEYHIYGFGNLEEKLKEQIENVGLGKNVKLLGYSINPEEVYQSAACSILTSDYEGFGLVLTESLAAGTPVVSYDIKYGPKEIVRDGIDGYLIEKGNIEELANSIIKIMKNNQLRKKLSNNAKEITNRFSKKKYIESWLSLFNELKS